MAQMMPPNWFDKKHGVSLESATAEEALEMIANDSRIIQELQYALAEHDAKAQPGPSRSQVIRSAVAEALQRAS